MAAGNRILNCFAFGEKPIEVISVHRRELDDDSQEQWSKIMLNNAALTKILLGNDDARSLPVGFFRAVLKLREHNSAEERVVPSSGQTLVDGIGA